MDSIGVWRGISSAAGLSGTFVYQIMAPRMGLFKLGMVSTTFQFICLSLCFASFFIHDNNTSLLLLICGVCTSRVGLWVFDVTVTQVRLKT